jgi:hypothetical protein
VKRELGTLVLGLLAAHCGSRSGLGTLPTPNDAPSPPLQDAGTEEASHDATADVVVPVDCYGAGVTVLAPSEGSPTDIAVDETHVYWTVSGSGCSDGAVRRMPKAGGPIETLASNEPNPRRLVLDQDRIYYYDGCGSGLLRSVPKAGGAIQTYPVSVKESGDALAVTAKDIYFSDYGVLRTPKGGGAQVTVDGQNYVYDLTADDDTAYWIGLVGGGPGYAVRSHHAGQTGATLLATPDSIGNAIALDATSIYFSSSPGIRRMPKTGGTPVVVTSASTWRLAVDESFVYWTDGFSGSGGFSVNKVPKNGGPTTELVAGDGAYVSLAVDERCVYWANLYGGEIGRVPK